MATYSSVLAWRVPGKGEPGGLPSMGLHRVGHDWSDLAASKVTIHSLDVLFPNLEPVHCSMSGSNCCFSISIHVSQEAGKVAWYSHVFKSFPQFFVIHIVKGFSVVNETEVDVFLEFSLAFAMIWWMLAIWSLVPLPLLNSEHLEVHGSHTVEASLWEFWALFC